MKIVNLAATLLLASIVTLTAPAARADVYNLNVDHCSSGGCLNLTNGGTVTVLQGINSSTVTFSVQLLSGLAFQLDTDPTHNNDTTFAFNSDISTLSISNLSSGWNPQSGTPTSGSQSDGFGTFGFGIACPSPICASGQITNPTSVSFTLTNTAGMLHPSDFAFLSTGGTAAYFAADVVSNRNGGINTGYIGSTGGVPSVPDGGTTAMLLSFALTGVGFMARRIKK